MFSLEIQGGRSEQQKTQIKLSKREASRGWIFTRERRGSLACPHARSLPSLTCLSVFLLAPDFPFKDRTLMQFTTQKTRTILQLKVYLVMRGKHLVKEARKGFFYRYSVCEMMKGNKKFQQIKWVNYKYLCNSLLDNTLRLALTS